MDFFDGDNNTNQDENRRSPAPAAVSGSESPGGVLPARADVKTQEQLMNESIAAIEERGKAKFDALQEEIHKRTQAADVAAHDAVAKMHADADAELRKHVSSREEAVASARKSNEEAQKQLLSQQTKLEEKGTTWELVAAHCDLSKPNARAQRSTDRMRKMLSGLATETNVPIGAAGSH